MCLIGHVPDKRITMYIVFGVKYISKAKQMNWIIIWGNLGRDVEPE